MSQPIAIIAARTAEAFGVPLSEMVSERRTRDVVVARHVAMTLARKLTPASYPRIARAFKRGDHSTAMHAERATAVRMERDPELARKVDELFDRLSYELNAVHGRPQS
ncbi:helix-turn-helix domain-containing protein [Rhodospirillum centenum]|uniref:helix-turn-helix domain-containing protein n=1 Tax=Rhodospirillum centenum TaxID=34018 RepID=UPI0002D4960C|nr:helix-turn-helix domain-containing protein [Rhodospirillum centenum]